LVGYLRHVIQVAYRVHIHSDPDPSSIIEDSNGNPIYSRNPVSFKQKIDYCIQKELLPFLYEHKRNKGEEAEVVITSNILSELKRHNRSQNNSSNYTLAALASEIPSFKVDQRKINGENKKVACGSKEKFYEFITPNIQEGDGLF
jgi:hypothetical protein